MSSSLLLDSSIRDWVVLPMFLLLCLVDIGRQYVQTLIKSAPEPSPAAADEMRRKALVVSLARLRINGCRIDESAFNRRKLRLIRKSDGLLRDDVPGVTNPMSNPNMMVDMIKNQGVVMLPNFVMMNFIQSFFNGFVCLKVPFPLPSNGFKVMLQRGVDLSSLDISYVSSVSWYFLITFGMQGAYQLVLGSGIEMADPRMAMQMGLGNNAVGFDAKGAYAGELAALSVCRHRPLEALSYTEERKLLQSRFPTGTEDLLDLTKFSKPK
jgi:hypothetical protein